MIAPNCTITSPVTMDGSNLTLHGAGEFNIRAYINNTDKIINFNPGDGKCKINIYPGGGIA